MWYWKTFHTRFSSYILQNFLRRSRYLLRSYSGECLGSSSDEERSELRYAIWIAEFRELLDLWTHAAFWRDPVCRFTGVFNSFFRHGGFSRGSACSACVSSLLGTSNASEAPCEFCEFWLSRRSSGWPTIVYACILLVVFISWSVASIGASV